MKYRKLMLNSGSALRRQRGLSLIEVLVTIAVVMVVMVGLLQVLLGSYAAKGTVQAISEVQNNGRVALDWITRDLYMSGNTGVTYSREPVVQTSAAGMSVTLVDNCFDSGSQAFDWGLAILSADIFRGAPMTFGVDVTAVAETKSVFSGCIEAADLKEGSDILSVHYVSPATVAPADMVSGGVYLHSGIGGGVIFQCATDGTDCADALTDKRTDPSGTFYYALVSRAYFIRDWGYVDGDGIDALVRVELNDTGSVETQLLAEGITNLQVIFGVDTDNDGLPDSYRDAADMPALDDDAGISADWLKVKSVRVSLLASSQRTIEAIAASTTYTVGNTDVVLPGTEYAQVYTTSVSLRNPSSRIVE